MRRWLTAAVVLVLAITLVGIVRPWSDRAGTKGETQTARTAGPSARPDPGEPPFVRSVSANGRHFLDQYGTPILVRGDSPWSLMTDLSPLQAKTYLADRQRRGVNAIIVSLLGAVDNGAPSDDGATVDGIRPFSGQDFTDWNPEYWARAHSFVRTAQERGITVLLYPLDVWVMDLAHAPADVDQCAEYGDQVARHFADLSNIVWMGGGDYFPEGNPAEGTDVDHCYEAMFSGIRDAGDDHLSSMQLGRASPTITTDSPYWETRVDWNFVYTYEPTHSSVARAYQHQPPIPALLGEANYERENNQENQPTTNETLRRQVAWALTEGAAGDVYGSDDWEFLPGWEGRLDEPGLADVGHVRDVFAGLPWWRLAPDADGDFLTGGRGSEVTADGGADVLDSDRATATITPDGSSAVIYVPTTRTLTIDDSRLGSSVRVVWVDPSTGEKRPTDGRSRYRTPGPNTDGDEDWLLVFSTSD